MLIFVVWDSEKLQELLTAAEVVKMLKSERGRQAACQQRPLSVTSSAELLTSVSLALSSGGTALCSLYALGCLSLRLSLTFTGW